MPLPHGSDALDVPGRPAPPADDESPGPAGTPPSSPARRAPGRKRAENVWGRTIRASDLTDPDLTAWWDLYRRDGRLPFESPHCLLTWTAHHDPPGRRTFVLFVYDADDLVAVIPLHRQRLTALGGTRLIMLGADQAAAVIEIPAALVQAGAERRVWRAAISHLADGAPRWNWLQLSLQDFLTFEPDWLPAGRGLAAIPLMTRTSVVIRHEQPSATSRNLKESLRRARNRLTRDFGGNWSVDRSTGPDQIDQAYARLIHNHQLRAGMAGRRAHHDVLSGPGDTAMLGELARAFSRDKDATIYELTADGQCLASLLVLTTSRASYVLLTGMTEQAWTYSALTLLTAVAGGDSAERGEGELRLPTGVDTSKLRWSRTLGRQEEFAVVGPRRRDRLAFACYDQLRAWSRRRRAQRSANARRDESRAGR